jgi:hypothetical protein
MWEMCGGRNSAVNASKVDPAVCCPEGSSCNYVNDWYWQCQPGAPSTGTSDDCTQVGGACSAASLRAPDGRLMLWLSYMWPKYCTASAPTSALQRAEARGTESR